MSKRKVDAVDLTIENPEPEPKRQKDSYSSDFECQLVIDSRERVNIDGQTKTFVSYVKTRAHWETGKLFTGTLPLGDIIIKSGENIRAVYERKTVVDFVASVNDKRFEEQRGRLLTAKKEKPTTIYGYIIEGEIAQEVLGNHNARHIQNLIWQLGTYDLQVIRTENYTETCDFLCSMRRMIADSSTLENAQDDAILTMTNYSGRKKSLNSENTLPQFLKLIEGVSPKHAIAIAERYGNLANLTVKFDNNPHLLVGLVYGDKKKIGKILSKKIHNRIYGIPEEVKTPK